MFTDNLFTLILTQALFLKEIFWSLNYELNICFWPLDARLLAAILAVSISV